MQARRKIRIQIKFSVPIVQMKESNKLKDLDGKKKSYEIDPSIPVNN